MAKVLRTWEETCPGCGAKATFRRYDCGCIDWESCLESVHNKGCGQEGFFTSQVKYCGPGKRPGHRVA